jgi:hypothetical protein
MYGVISARCARAFCAPARDIVPARQVCAFAHR